jgi:hypothetical protein
MNRGGVAACAALSSLGYKEPIPMNLRLEKLQIITGAPGGA